MQISGNPGAYRGSSHSSVKIVVYGDGVDNVGNLTIGGHSRQDLAPSIVSATTTNALGTAGGSFSFTVKPGRLVSNWLEYLVPDSWVDIAFTRGAKEFHVMRGRIDTVLEEGRIINGVSTRSYTVNGRSFGKIFEITPLYFDLYSEGDFVGLAAGNIWNREDGFAFGPPNTTVKSFLFGFIEELRNRGRAVWQHPGLPGEVAPAPSAVVADFGIAADMWLDTGFSNYPARQSSIVPTLYMPTENFVWPLAASWSDPAFCELFCDLVPTENFSAPSTKIRYFQDSEPCPIGAARSAVIFRDRPFPTSQLKLGGTPIPLRSGPWFSELPTYGVPQRSILSATLAQSDLERKNTFFVQTLLTQAYNKMFFQLQVPMIHRADVEAHSVRRFDVGSQYLPTSETEDSTLGMATSQRLMAVDYHCLDHEFRTGTVQIAPGRPDIRIGGKLWVPEYLNEGLNAYIEGVTHTWQAPAGLRTELLITRGWVGDDASLATAVEDRAGEFETLKSSAPPAATDTAQVAAVELAPGSPGNPRQPPSWANGVEVFPPFSEKLQELMRQAISYIQSHPTAGSTQVTEEWVDSSAFHLLYSYESWGGCVGIPNYYYGERTHQPHTWPTIWDELRQGIKTSRRNAQGEQSTATGLGQMILANVKAYYPDKENSIGIALDELIGMLRYIADRYGSPEAAWAFWNEVVTITRPDGQVRTAPRRSY